MRSAAFKVDPRELAAIFAGGVSGAVLRIALARLPVAAAPAWPWVTLAVNILGAFALGYFVTRLQERLPVSAYRRPLLATGFCGAFTTFSAMQIELLRMVDAHSYERATGYAVVSIVGGYAAVHLASALVRRVRRLT